jgi:hypothetical protein
LGVSGLCFRILIISGETKRAGTDDLGINAASAKQKARRGACSSGVFANPARIVINIWQCMQLEGSLAFTPGILDVHSHTRTIVACGTTKICGVFHAGSECSAIDADIQDTTSYYRSLQFSFNINVNIKINERGCLGRSRSSSNPEFSGRVNIQDVPTITDYKYDC